MEMLNYTECSFCIDLLFEKKTDKRRANKNIDKITIKFLFMQLEIVDPGKKQEHYFIFI